LFKTFKSFNRCAPFKTLTTEKWFQSFHRWRGSKRNATDILDGTSALREVGEAYGPSFAAESEAPSSQNTFFWGETVDDAMTLGSTCGSGNTAPSILITNKVRGSDAHLICGRFRTKEKTMGWIVSDADHLGGKPRVRDTRIAVALLLEWLAAGMTIGEIVKDYPSLTEDAVRGTLDELAHSDLLAPSENPSRREHA
jgi:uncharacterized protein (DUF433 family)